MNNLCIFIDVKVFQISDIQKRDHLIWCKLQSGSSPKQVSLSLQLSQVITARYPCTAASHCIKTSQANTSEADKELGLAAIESVKAFATINWHDYDEAISETAKRNNLSSPPLLREGHLDSSSGDGLFSHRHLHGSFFGLFYLSAPCRVR